jgi:hypothetical protein
MKMFILSALLLVGLVGCGNKLSPLSPELTQKLNNQDGKIDEVKNNQNGLMLELGKLRQSSEVHARDIANYQQAIVALKDSHNNAGVQILQGDGAMIMVFAILVIALLLVYHYRTKAVKHEKTAEMLAQQIGHDTNMANRVFMAALDSEVEENVYALVAKNQKKAAIFKALSKP